MATQNNRRAATPAKAPRTGRRSPWAAAALIGIGLLITGGVYAGATAASAGSGSNDSVATSLTTEDGKKLFQANCASCHGMNLQGTSNGPTLIGVGAMAVDFQVGTGRMPLQAQGPQAPSKPVQFTDAQVTAMADWVQSVSPGPGIADERYLDGEGDAGRGAELFRINCALCHNAGGAGGALTEGKYAPGLAGVLPQHIYAAMATGPQNMPVFSDMNLTPDDKRDIISALMWSHENGTPGGYTLGGFGPVAEGLFIWIFGIGGLVAVTVWITAKSN